MKTSIAAAVAACLVLTGGAPLPPASETPPVNPFMVGLAMPDVDVELMLMADVSRSMGPEQMKTQRDGYLAALRSQEVAAAIRQGAHGRIAIAYAEFAGDFGQEVVVDWTIVSDEAGLNDFADRLAAAPSRGFMDRCEPCSRGTSVGGAISFAHERIIGNSVTGERLVMDISGDGKDNWAMISASVERNRAVASGITINGLPIVAGESGLEGWYRANVIGGAGAFIVPVHGFSNFGEAVRRKLVLEIAGRAPVQQYAME